jgi:hypothetical protein
VFNPAPLDPAKILTAMIQWLVKAAVARWFGRQQSSQISLALAGIMEIQQLFERLAALIAAGPGALQPPQAHRRRDRAARPAAPRIRLAAQAGGEADAAWWPVSDPAPILQEATADREGGGPIARITRSVRWVASLNPPDTSAWPPPPASPQKA